MVELRKDYILNRWVIYASKRKKRPRELGGKEIKKESVCYFCPGNEHLTPHEIGRVAEKGRWKMRWFPNKFPFVDEKGKESVIKTKFFNSMPAYGKNEVIAECREHKKQMWDLPKEHIKQILEIYKNRIQELNKLKGMKYVLIFKNHGEKAGTSLTHSHTQVAALNKIPGLVEEEIKAVNRYFKCPYCDIINLERKSKRKCFENKSIIAFAPYASRFNYEIWLFPKRHVTNITKLNDKEITDLADILRKALIKLKKINASYNFFLHYASNLHFHIEITPRIATWGGFETSSNMTINSVTPESAAKFYRK